MRDDVIEECNKHGGVLHIYVDKASLQGNVYVKCPTISAAVASVGALHGRYFAGRMWFYTLVIYLWYYTSVTQTSKDPVTYMLVSIEFSQLHVYVNM